MTGVAVVVSAVLGLSVGSFLGLVAYRVPEGESILRPRSRCPSCGYVLGPLDNIPVASWLILRGRCRSCRGPISWRYPAAEALTALLWVVAALQLGTCRGCRVFDAVAFMPFLGALVCLSVVDLERRLIPNRILYPALGIGGVLIAIAAATGPGWGTFGRAVAAGLVSFAVFNVIHLVSPAGMGYGDVRLSGLIGFHLGYLGWGRVYAGFLVGFLVGSVAGIGLMLAGKAGRKTAVPFG
ncbi:MAG: prepilin peptidase, partial [Actinomycetota bacterium]